MSIRCTKCKKTKDTKRFQKDARYASGFHSWCKECKLVSQRLHYATYKTWVSKNSDRVKEIKAAYVKRNIEKVKDSKRKWNAANPKKRLANCRKRQAMKLQATPKWLTKDQLRQMTDFYLNCPKGHHVDHVIPLRGKTSRGLHVPWNLQYLKASDNHRKSNRIEE